MIFQKLTSRELNLYDKTAYTIWFKTLETFNLVLAHFEQ